MLVPVDVRHVAVRGLLNTYQFESATSLLKGLFWQTKWFNSALYQLEWDQPSPYRNTNGCDIYIYVYIYIYIYYDMYVYIFIYYVYIYILYTVLLYIYICVHVYPRGCSYQDHKYNIAIYIYIIYCITVYIYMCACISPWLLISRSHIQYSNIYILYTVLLYYICVHVYPRGCSYQDHTYNIAIYIYIIYCITVYIYICVHVYPRGCSYQDHTYNIAIYIYYILYYCIYIYVCMYIPVVAHIKITHTI